MKKLLYFALIVVVGVGTFFVGFEYGNKYLQANTGKLQDAISQNMTKTTIETPASFAPLVKKAMPAVVNISVEKVIKYNFPKFKSSPFHDDPFDDFFERFFGFRNIPKEGKQTGLGSGFIVSEDGYILTNHHVVANVDKIIVKLYKDENEYEAKIIGTDERTDVALIKINANRSLPVLPLGDSDAIEIGDWVIAIGNPLGLSHTVTKGIVSYKGRKEVKPGGPNMLADFIQTDAPINRGNSGGPLLNMKGEVIGINESISAAAQNIGFAVPINMVKVIMPQLKEKGMVERAWLGISLGPVPDEVIKNYNLKSKKGAYVYSVFRDSPADKAGIKPDDIIVEYNGKKIETSDDLPWLVSNSPINKPVKIKLLREGKEIVVEAKPAKMPSDEELEKRSMGQVEKSSELGIEVENLPPEVMRRERLSYGVRVKSVSEGSLADEADIRVGDIILELNNNKIHNANQFMNIYKNIPRGKPARFMILRDGAFFYIVIKK
ncbi:MAG: Do family serine endopeptidase [Deltaproteobacteria bacterium]|nr:Do family serine endopeptidase [Deltaproteobacteria bacterium]